MVQRLSEHAERSGTIVRGSLGREEHGVAATLDAQGYRFLGSVGLRAADDIDPKVERPANHVGSLLDAAAVAQAQPAGAATAEAGDADPGSGAP